MRCGFKMEWPRVFYRDFNEVWVQVYDTRHGESNGQ